MVEVFKTDVKNQEQANFMIDRLQTSFPECNMNFDLEDCDNIFRIEGKNLFGYAEDIHRCFEHFGFMAFVLDDAPKVSRKQKVESKL